jgi:hypothetical protein
MAAKRRHVLYRRGEEEIQLAMEIKVDKKNDVGGSMQVPASIRAPGNPQAMTYLDGAGG